MALWVQCHWQKYPIAANSGKKGPLCYCHTHKLPSSSGCKFCAWWIPTFICGDLALCPIMTLPALQMPPADCPNPKQGVQSPCSMADLHYLSSSLLPGIKLMVMHWQVSKAPFPISLPGLQRRSQATLSTVAPASDPTNWRDWGVPDTYTPSAQCTKRFGAWAPAENSFQGKGPDLPTVYWTGGLECWQDLPSDSALWVGKCYNPSGVSCHTIPWRHRVPWNKCQ